ncbi:MAG: hypothetical protein ACREEM_03800 [Blastocatellia bacterium]
MDEQRSQQSNDVWRGIGLALLFHLIQIPLAVVTLFISLIFIGLTQLLYIIPAIVIYKRKGRPGVVKGLIIAAAVTFLLSATCTVLTFTSLDFR